MTSAAGRRAGGVALAMFGLPLLTLALDHARGSLTLESQLLLYLLLVVGVALIGGVRVAAACALAAALLLNFYFTEPRHTLQVTDRDQLIALVVFTVVATAIAFLVDLAARREASAREAGTLAELAERGLDRAPTLIDVLERARSALGLRAVALTDEDGTAAHAGAPGGPTRFDIPAGGALRLVGYGDPSLGDDQRVWRAFAAAARDAYEDHRRAEQASADRLRDAILQAVGHDLRTPLAGIKAAAGALRSPAPLSARDREELLATVEDGADRLDAITTDLLDMSRLRADAVRSEPRAVSLEEVVDAALLDVGPAARRQVDPQISGDLPLVQADPALLERVLANLLTNAERHAPGPVEVRGEVAGDEVSVLVRDHGPGLAPAQREAAFTPFQRHGDRDGAGTGVGLGLAVARGLAQATGGRLEAEDTPGGGLTMRVTLRRAPP